MLFSSLKNQIIYFPDGEKAGKIKAAIIDYGTGKICELILSSVFKKKIFSIDNILMDKEKITLRSGNEEIAAESKYKGDIISIKVYTENGSYLGKVRDFEINSYFWRLSQIFASKRLESKTPFAISDDQIVSISAKKIIVKDLAIEEAIPNLA